VKKKNAAIAPICNTANAVNVIQLSSFFAEEVGEEVGTVAVAMYTYDNRTNFTECAL
jgi:hypothetical protein